MCQYVLRPRRGLGQASPSLEAPRLHALETRGPQKGKIVMQDKGVQGASFRFVFGTWNWHDFWGRSWDLPYSRPLLPIRCWFDASTLEERSWRRCLGRFKTGLPRRHRIQTVEGPVLDPRAKETWLKRDQKVDPLEIKSGAPWRVQFWHCGKSVEGVYSVALMAQLVWRHSCGADRLPVVVRFPAGPWVRLKTLDPPKGNGLRQKKCWSVYFKLKLIWPATAASGSLNCIYTHRKPVWRSEIYRCFKSGLWCSDYSSCGESRHRHSQECLLQRGIVDVCASRLQTCSCKYKMRIWRMFKSPRPIFNVECCSFTFWTDSHQKEILPQVTSSNWNSLLSCNSINTPSTLTMGSQGFSLWLALVGAMQGKMAVRGSQGLRLPRFNVSGGSTGFSSAAPAARQPLRWPYWILKRCTCRASTFTMAAWSSQALHLPRFNF